MCQQTAKPGSDIVYADVTKKIKINRNFLVIQFVLKVLKCNIIQFVTQRIIFESKNFILFKTVD